MAGSLCATTAFLQPCAVASSIPGRRQSFFLAVANPSTSRIARRKNHLRQKLLKTLTNPYPNTILPQSPNPILVEPPTERAEEYIQLPSENFSPDQLLVEEQNEIQAFEVQVSEPSEAAGVFDKTAGIMQASNVSAKSVKSQKSDQLGKQNSEKIEARSCTTISSSNKSNSFSGNGNPRIRKGGSKFGNQKSNSEADLWWLSLPYVLAILMHRGLDGEGAQGLYSVKKIAQDMDGSSHTVMFEDRGDATNFCYLLESFFEDLNAFSAEIVPVPIKELGEAVKSHGMKVLVVKKGQLKLYVGQPLDDAETALCSLLRQS